MSTARTPLPQREPATDLPESVTIYEVGPRDGLQNEKTVVPVEVKAEFVRRLLAAGLPTVIHTDQRLASWRESMIDNELQPGPIEYGDFTVAGGAAATERLLGHTPRPTAIVCANDLMAIGTLQKLAQLGLSVPGDVSVTGYDGIEIGQYVTPALTTVVTDPAAVGRRAAALLLDVIDGLQVTDVEIEPAKLAVRGSTGPAASR